MSIIIIDYELLFKEFRSIYIY